LQVEQFLEKNAGRFPDKTALVCGTERLSYRELDRLSSRFANALVAHGVRRGDRVVVCLDNSSEAVISIFAVLKAGAVFVMLDHTMKSERLHYILNDCGATALVLPAEKISSVQDSLEASPQLQTVYLANAKAAVPPGAHTQYFSLNDVLHGSEFSDVAPPKKCIDADLAALIYTSGTTGHPKGVMLTHANMFAAAESVISYLRNNSDDVILSALRLSYSYGLYQMLTAFLVGGTILLERSLAYPHLLLEKMKKEGVTAFPLVPTIAAVLLQYDLKKYDLSSLRYITSAGAALPHQHARKLQEFLPHVQIFVMYGQTECKRISYLPPDQLEKRPDSVGIAIPNEEVYIVDEVGCRVGPGVVGELVVRGSHVMKGYWGLPEESAKALRPGPVPGEKVLYTGDLFKMDEQGYLYFVSRRDDIIKTRGEKVSPKEIEDVLYSIEGVLEAAVVGVPDEVLGQSIKAVVTLCEGVEMSKQEILRHCARRLEDFKIPHQVEFRATLPKTANGKISRKELQSPVESQA
jgi:long-chain acyl-CoA synthetase